MVYCGKPSKGCANCRERKIRCGQEQPVCTNCTKASKNCPGYRNMLDLAFRNESSSVIEKAKAKEKAKNAKAAQSTKPRAPKSTTATKPGITTNASSPGANSRAQCASPSPPSMILIDGGEFESRHSSPNAPLSLSLIERGTTYFVSNFVAEASGPSHGHFNYLREMCRDRAIDSTLSASMTAVGLASLSNRIGSSHLLGEARRGYMTALRQVNTALRSPTDSIKDSTLLSIMILTVFETVTCTNQLSLKAWTEHINGATALIKLRGPSQFQTRVGVGLFMQISAHLLISAVQREIPIPQEIVALRAQVQRRLDPSDVAFQFVAIVDVFTQFRANLREHQLGSSENIIHKALLIDEKLVQIFENAPPLWRYETVYAAQDEAPHIIFNGTYDIYYDYWIAQIWNGMRNARILLNEVVRQHILSMYESEPQHFTDMNYAAQYQLSTNTLVEMRDGILRSIPQHMGYVTRKPSTCRNTPSPTSSAPESPSSSSSSISDTIADLYSDVDFTFPLDTPLRSVPFPSHPAIGAYFLIWPLYIAGVTRVTTPAQRTFVTASLRRLHTDMGIAQGSALAEFIETNPMIVNRQEHEQKGTTVGLGRSILEAGRMQGEMKVVPGILHAYERKQVC